MDPNAITPLVEMKDVSIAFGGVKAVDHAYIDLYPGEVVGLLGHNGAGKSCLIKILSGAYKRDSGQIFINGQEVRIDNPRDAKHFGIETVYQALALADNVDAASNLYLGRELLTRWGTLDDASMEAEARKVMGRLNPNFRRFKEPVVALSGGFTRDEACERLAENHGMIASFSRALVQDLRRSMNDAEFDKALADSIDEIYQASTVKIAA